MKYLSPIEITANKDAIRDKFLKGRPLPLKGRSVEIFSKWAGSFSNKILEAGTGSGNFLLEIFKLGYKNIYGCDVGDYLVNGVRPALKDFKVLDLSFDKLLWPDGFFDTVVAWDVFEHLENPHNFVREANRILKTGGLYFLSMPNVFHIVSRLVFLKRGLFPRWSKNNNHISIFPHGIFEKTFFKYFDLVEEGYVYARISLPLFKKIKSLPENQWFGNWVYYVFKKK